MHSKSTQTQTPSFLTFVTDLPLFIDISDPSDLRKSSCIGKILWSSEGHIDFESKAKQIGDLPGYVSRLLASSKVTEAKADNYSGEDVSSNLENLLETQADLERQIEKAVQEQVEKTMAR